MPNTPAQFPNFDLPGAEWLSLAPNANIAIQGRRRKELSVPAPPNPISFMYLTQVPPAGNPPPPGTTNVQLTFNPGAGQIWFLNGQTIGLQGGTYLITDASLAPINQELIVQVITQSTAPLSTPGVPGNQPITYISGPGGGGSFVLESNFLPSSGIYIHFVWLGSDSTLTNPLLGLSLGSKASDYPLGNSIVPMDRDRLVIGRDIFGPPGTNLSLVAQASAAAIARIIYTRLDGFLE